MSIQFLLDRRIPARKATNVCSYARWFNRRNVVEVDTSFSSFFTQHSLWQHWRKKSDENEWRKKKRLCCTLYLSSETKKKRLNYKVNSRTERARERKGKLDALFYVSLASYVGTKDSLFEWFIWKIMIDLQWGPDRRWWNAVVENEWWEDRYESSSRVIGTSRRQSIDFAQMAQLIIEVSNMYIPGTTNLSIRTEVNQPFSFSEERVKDD